MSYMKSGSALRWAEMIMEEIAAQQFFTWKEFQDGLLATFSDTDRHATARLEIENVKQGNNTVDEYNIQFTEVAILTKYDKLTLIEKYKRGLKEAILSKIYALTALPTSLAEWRQRASLFDRRYRKLQQYHHGKPTSSSSSSLNRNPNTRQDRHRTSRSLQPPFRPLLPLPHGSLTLHTPPRPLLLPHVLSNKKLLTLFSPNSVNKQDNVFFVVAHVIGQTNVPNKRASSTKEKAMIVDLDKLFAPWTNTLLV